jgi:DNA-binding XRE family transcriptional regulator
MANRELVRRVGRPTLYPHLREPSRLQRGAEIKAFRASVGLSAHRLARLMHVSGQSVYNWERGVSLPVTSLWVVFLRVKRNYKQKLRRQGKDLDGGPVMEDKS